MKTAIQQLIDFLEPELKMHDFLQLPAYEKAKELLETEKQQIIDAYESGEKNIDFPALHGQGKLSDSNKYYESTFETKKETLK